MNRTQEIIDLTAKWYEYVSGNHHKDRDCHFYIEVDFAYGEHPTFTAQHYGYIGGNWYAKIHNTYAAAEADLLAQLKQMIRDQKDWVDEVLADESQWDEYQIEQAKLYRSLFGADQ